MLRRRHHAQTQTPRKTESRQEAHETDRLGRSAPGGFPRHFAGAGLMQAAMGTITAVILAAFAAYAGAWYTGAVEGNFAVLLMLATVVTGVYWVIEKLVFLP